MKIRPSRLRKREAWTQRLLSGHHGATLENVEFTYNEDALLVKFSESMSIVTDWDEFVSLHRQQHDKAPHLFPRTNLDRYECQARLLELQTRGVDLTPSARYRLIRKDLQLERDELAHAISGPAAGEQMVVVEPVLHPTAPKIQIGFSGRRFEPATLIADRGPLAETSHLLQRLTESFVPTAERGVPRVQFSDLGEKYDGIDTLDHMHPTNFKRFILWAHNRGILTREREIVAKLTTVVSDFTELKSALASETHMRKAQRLDELARVQRAEEKRLRVVLDRQFREDMRILEAQHEMQVAAHLAQTSQRYARLQRELDALYSSQLVQMTAIAEQLLRSQVALLETGARDVRRVTERIFSASTTLPLAFLAEELEADELIGDCVAYIAEHIGHFARQPAMSSPLLSNETIQQLLSKLDSTSIEALAEAPVLGLSRDLVAHELHYRRRLTAQEATAWPLFELRKRLEAPGTAFKDLLRDELARRLAASAGVDVTTGRASAHASIVGLEMGVAKTGRYVLAHASAERHERMSGAVAFEVSLLECPASAAVGSVSVGFDAARTVYDGPLAGQTPSEHGGCAGFMWQSDGFVHLNGVSSFIGVGFGKADVVAVVLDHEARSISFYRNGTALVSLVKGNALKTIRLAGEHYMLAPAVCLFAARGVDDVRVFFNFAGPFAPGLPPSVIPIGGNMLGR